MTLEPTGGNSTQDPNTPAAGSDPAQSQLPAAEAWDSMPKSWKAEMADHYKSISPDARRYIHEREGQVEKGIRSYHDRASRWDKLHGEFAEIFSANPNLDAHGFFGGLARNHLALVQAQDPATRTELFKQLAQHYGVEWSGSATPQGEQGLGPDVTKLIQQATRPLEQKISAWEKEKHDARVAEFTKELDAFASDPKNKYFNEAVQGIGDLIKAGFQGSIAELYEMALMRNPELKAKYLADLAAASGAQPPANKGALNVKNSAAPASPGKPASMDDTMRKVLDKHYPKS